MPLEAGDDAKVQGDLAEDEVTQTQAKLEQLHQSTIKDAEKNSERQSTGS